MLCFFAHTMPYNYNYDYIILYYGTQSIEQARVPKSEIINITLYHLASPIMLLLIS